MCHGVKLALSSRALSLILTLWGLKPGVCENTDGSFVCRCADNYWGDGLTVRTPYLTPRFKLPVAEFDPATVVVSFACTASEFTSRLRRHRDKLASYDTCDWLAVHSMSGELDCALWEHSLHRLRLCRGGVDAGNWNRPRLRRAEDHVPLLRVLTHLIAPGKLRAVLA